MLSTGATDLNAKQLFNGQGGLINSASLSAQVGQLNNNGGRLTSVDGLTLDMTQGHLNNQDGLINAAQLTLKNLNSVDNRRGEISSAQAFALMAQSLDNSHGKLLGNQALTLRLDQALSNVSGLISSNGLEATAATLDNRSGIVTSRGDLALSLAGALNNHAGEVSSLGSTTLKGVSLDNSDGQVSGDLALSIDLSAGLNNQKGVLGSGKNLDLKTASLDNRQAGSLISDDRLSARINDLLDNQLGDISAKGLIDVQAGRLDNRNGSLTGKDLLTLRADALDNRGGLLSALGLVHLDAASLDNSGGRISSKSGLSAQVKQLINQRGALVTEGELSLKGSHLDNRDSGLVGATKALKLDVGEIDNRGGEVSSSQGVVLQGARLDNSDSGKVLAGTDLGLSVAQIINQNQGLLFGKAALALSGQSLDNSRGSLVAMHGLDILLDQALSNLQGLMSSEGTLSAQVGSLDNGDGKVSSAAALTLTSAGALLNRHGSITTDAALNISSQRLDNRDQGLISSKGAAQVSAGTFDNTEGARLISGDRLELNAAQVRNGEGSRIASEKNLTASVSGFDQQGGELFSKTALSLDLNQGQLNNHKGLINAPVLVLKNLADVNNQGGEISSTQAFTLAARNLDNSSGKLISQQGLSLGIDRALNNLKGLISAKTLDLRSNHLDNTEGLLSSRGAQVLKVDGTLNNQGGRLIASQGLELGAGSLDNRQGGLVNASLGLQLKVDAIDNRGGELSSQSEVNLSGSSLDNSDGGKVLAEGALGLVVAQVINRSKGLLSGKAGLTLSGNSLDNSGGSLLSLQDLKAEVQGNLDNRQGLLSAEGRLGLKSAELNNNAGSLSSAGALTLEHSGALLNQGGAILTDGALVLNSARLDNRNQGNISAQAAASINTGALDNSHSGSLSSGDSLNLSTGQLTNQDQGRIASGAALTASVSGLDQQGGQLFSNTALTLDLNQGQLNNQQGLINAPLLMLKNLKDVNNQGGEISAAQAFTLAADSLDNSLGKLISNDRLSLKAQSLLNQGGLVSGWQGLSANLRSLDNRNQGTLSSRSGGLDLQVSGDLQNSNAGALVSQKALNVVAANLDNSSGGIVSSAGEQNLNLSGVLNNTQGGQIDSGAALTLNLLGILSNNNGQLASAGPLRIERASQIDNQGGQIASQGLLTLFSGALDNRNRGTLAANEQLTLTVDAELQNSGDGLIYSQNSGLHVKAGSLVNGKGTLQSQGAMSLTTRGDIDNQSGRMLAKNGDLTIGANNLDNHGGVLASLQGAMTANLSGVLKNGYDLNNNRLGGVTQAQRLTLKALAGIDNYGGRISAQSGNALITTRDFDNRNGGLYANSLVNVSGGNLDNSGEQGGRIAGQQVDLDLSGALNNRLGIIESASTLAIKAASLDNQAGQLRALGASGTTRFEIGGQFDNRNGTLESANSNLSLGVGSFLNDSGNLLHVGSGTFDIATANVSGAGGSIVTRGGLTLNADSWHNNSVIQAGRLTVNVNTFSQTASGQLLASETLTGSGGNWSNDGLIASDGSLSLTLGGTYLGNGRLSSRGTLGLDAAQLNLNAAASIAGGADTTLAIGGQLTNAGRLTSGAKLNLSAGAVSNQGTLGAAQDLTLTTGALLNDHALVFSGGDMNLRVDSLTNSYADIYSLGNLTIDRDGQGTLASSIINSSGSLQSDGSMSLAASTLQNVRAVLTTDNRGIYSARIGEIACIEGVNAGDCSGKRNHVWEIVQRDKFEVTEASAASSITSGGNLLINGGDLLNRSSTIAAAGNLVATLNNLTNSGVETGETETTRVFRSARTRNASSWSNAANAFTNRYWFQSGGYNPNNLGGLEGAMASFIGRTEREYTNLGSTRKLAGGDQSYAAVIQAGGAVNVRAGNGIDSAVVRPGYTYVGSGARTNTDAPGTAFATRVTLNPQLPPDLAQQQVNPLALPGFNLPTGQSGLFRLSDQGGSTPLASGSQDWAMGGAGLSTAAHQQTLPVASVQSINDVDAAQFVAGSADLNTANRTAATVSAEASEINAALPGAALAPSPLLHAPSVTGDGISQASVLNGQLVPPSLLSIDRVQGLPDSSVRSSPHKYLIETNPALTNLKQFMSSDYLLSKLGYDPDDSWKRLGDGFYEQKLIQQAVVARTGQRFLAGQNTDEQLFKYLMDNAIKSKQSLNLAVGVSLSSEQVAALTHDIVWLENAEVNGEQVLVPVLYMAQANNRLAPNGALIAGSDVNLIAGQDLNNVGTLRATHNLLAQAGQNLVNSGLMEAGNRLDLLAGNNLVNKAGGILAGRDVSLTATQGDVINERTLTSHQSSNGSYTQQRDFVDNAARVEAVNDLVINAGRDLNNNGGALKSGADTTIKAGRDVNLTSVEQVVSNDRGARHNNLSITQNGSSLEAGRDLSINAGRDISAIASQIEAKRDVTMTATDNLTLASAGNEQHSYSKSKKVTSQEDHVQQVSTTLVAGGNVALSAGQDIDLIASRVSAGDEAYLYAGNDVNLESAENTDYSYYSKTKKGSWGKKKSTMTESGSEDVVSSVIQAQGKTMVVAANDVNISGSTINTDKGALSVLSGHDVNLEAAQNSQFSASAKSKSGGFGLSSTSKKSSDASSSTSLTGSTLSGNTTLVQAGNDLLVSASNVVSTEQTNLQAGKDIRIESGIETFSSQRSQSTSKSGLMSSGGIGVTLGSSKNSFKQDTQGRTEKGSTIGSVQGDAVVTAGKDLTVKASDVVAGKDISLIGQNVSIIDADSESSTRTNQESKKSGLTLALSGVVGSAVNTAVQTVQDARREDDSRLAALQGIKAGLSGYQAWQGAQALEAGAQEGSFFGIALSLGTQKSSSKQMQEQAVSQGSGLTAGHDLRVIATGNGPSGAAGDLSVVGGKLQAGHDVLLSAARDIDLRAGANTQKLDGSNKSGGGAVGISLGVGSGGGGLSVFANANSGVGKEKGNGTTWTETTVNAGNQLTLNSGRDTTLEGAQANAQKVVADIGRNLTLTSLQDSDRFDSKQTNVSGGVSVAIIGSGGSASLSVSQDKIKSRFDSVQEQTGLFAGQDGYQVTVGEHTQLNGSVLASTSSADKNKLDTGTLGWSDIRNKADFSSQHQSVSGGTGGDLGSMFMGNMGSLLLLGSNNSGHDSSTTYAAVSDGQITVRDQDKQLQDVATLSRDVEHANNALSPIFDKEKEQKRLRQAQLIGDIGNQAMDIIRTQGSIEAAKAAAAELTEEQRNMPGASRDASVKDRAAYVAMLQQTDAYRKVMADYGTGSNLQRAAQAVTAAVQGIAGGDFNQALVGASAPYLAGLIKESIPDNLEARLMAHAVLGAVLAKSQGNSALAGAAGASIGELVATKLFPGKSVDQLTEADRQKISALSTLAGGLLGGLVGGDLANAVSAGETAKNASENNAMGMDVGSNLGLWFSNNKDCDTECKGKIAQQKAAGGLILSGALLVAITAAVATPEVIALTRAAGQSCKANPTLCFNEVNIWLAEVGMGEALPAGLVAGGAAKLTADQLSDVRSLMELQRQTGKPVSSEALSIALGAGSTGKSLPTQTVKTGALETEEGIQKLIDTLAFRKRTLELSMDPDRGQSLIREGIGAARFEQATGRTVTRSTDGATDFIDSKLGAFDLKGPLRANDGSVIDITPVRLEGLGNSIIKEANNSTASKAVVVDTLGLTREQILTLKNQVSGGLKTKKPIVYIE